MLLSSMNFKEIWNEINIDLNNVNTKFEYLLMSGRRKCIKSKNKHYKDVISYKSPRNNKWLIFIDVYKKVWYKETLIYYENEDGINAILVNNDRQLMHVSAHFLKRYKERFLHQENIQTIELIKKYFSENIEITMENNLESINEEKTDKFFLINEGIALGEIEVFNGCQIFYLKTFITPDMLFDDQYKIYNPLVEYSQTHEMVNLKNVA